VGSLVNAVEPLRMHGQLETLKHLHMHKGGEATQDSATREPQRQLLNHPQNQTARMRIMSCSMPLKVSSSSLMIKYGLCLLLFTAVM
jgi:hypothetical protein